jgi:hypothetical protein
VDWPAAPHGYFTPQSLERLAAFRAQVGPTRDPTLLAEFPMADLTAQIQVDWRPGAVRIYQNWLAFVAAAKERTPRKHLLPV